MLYTAKKFRLWLIAAITALSVIVLAGTSAIAAEPGEQNLWFSETGANTQIKVNYGGSDARDLNGNVFLVWHDAATNYIYASYNGVGYGMWPGAVTNAAPRVIWTDYGWRVFHTGEDGNIYYAGAEINPDGTISYGAWQQVPYISGSVYQYDPPAVAALPGQESWYLVWRNRGNNALYGQYHHRDGGSASWDGPNGIPGAYSYDHPGISYDPSWNRLVVAWTGTDSTVSVSMQTYGTPNWSNIVTLPGVFAAGGPAVALTDDGNGQIAVRNIVDQQSRRMALAHIWLSAGQLQWTGAWTQESTGWETPVDPWLSAAGTFIYLVAAAYAADYYYPLYWKQSGWY